MRVGEWGMRVYMIAIAAALALGACTPLTSEHPVFSHADETGPSPLTEGVWVALEDNCTREMATATPIAATCDPLTLRRTADGWQLNGQEKGDNDVVRTVEIPIIIVPAVRTTNADAYAPLYIVQLSTRDANSHSNAPAGERVYGVIAPTSTMPATEMFFTDIDCAAVLREGPIDGVAEHHNADGVLDGCTTTSPAAVREAARRAMIESLGNIDRERLIFVHP
jgi:hypothetical protein